MHTHADKTQENKNQSVSNVESNKQSSAEPILQFIDNRPEALAQRKLQEMANDSLQAKQTAQLNAIADIHTTRLEHPIQKKENNTGLPDNLKTGVENLSGYSMDDVKVHKNSDKPAQLQAHAYAQGTDIHLGPGQEKHLPHEAWHVVQQKQGRVMPTKQMKGIGINDDTQLEKEADVMGAKVLQNGAIKIHNTRLEGASISHVKQLQEFSSQELDGQHDSLETDKVDSVNEFLNEFRTDEDFLETRGMLQLPLDLIKANAEANKYGELNEAIKKKIDDLLSKRNSDALPKGITERSATPQERAEESDLHSKVYEKYISDENQAAIKRVLAWRGNEYVSVLYRGTGYAQALQIATERTFGGVKPLKEGEGDYLKTEDEEFKRIKKEQVGLGTAEAKKTLNEWTEKYSYASGYAKFGCMLICAVRDRRDYVYFREDQELIDSEEFEDGMKVGDLKPEDRIKYIEGIGGEAGVLADSRLPLLDVAIYRCVATPLFPKVKNGA